MQSIRSKIIIWLIKNRHLFKMKLKSDMVDANSSVTKFREDTEKAVAKIKMPKNVTVKNEIIDSFNTEWIIPEKPVDGKVLLYIHGGGFISGSCSTQGLGR